MRTNSSCVRFRLSRLHSPRIGPAGPSLTHQAGWRAVRVEDVGVQQRLAAGTPFVYGLGDRLDSGERRDTKPLRHGVELAHGLGARSGKIDARLAFERLTGHSRTLDEGTPDDGERG